MFQNISGETFFRLSEQDNTVILDVRTPMEAAMGSIPGSLLIDMFSPDFIQKLQALDHDKTYLVYCRSGNRSAQTCSIMAQMGFKDLYNLASGMIGWQGPVVSAEYAG
jgi:rhodanese-related sulfurtransferase